MGTTVSLRDKTRTRQHEIQRSKREARVHNKAGQKAETTERTPMVKDLEVQRTVKSVIELIFEADLKDFSYACRKGRLAK